MVNGLPLNVAFDEMLKELNIKAQEVSRRSQVSPSRLSQFRTGNGGDITVRSLDALLNAAQSINPKAKAVFAHYVGEIDVELDQMSLAEKGALMIAIGKSIQTSISTDSKSDRTA